MKTKAKVLGAIAVALAAVLVASCNLSNDSSTSSTPPQAIIDTAKELRRLVPAIQAGMALAKEKTPTARALDPVNQLRKPADWPTAWTGYTPDQVYKDVNGPTGTGTIRLPATGYYNMSNGNQIYLTLTPETSLGATYYRLVLYTYPALDLSVAYTIEEYIVNSAGTEDWAWGNLNLTKDAHSWISQTTAYLDGTTGTRTVQSVSGSSGPYYPAFTVGDPVPGVTSSFVGYRHEEIPPATQASGMNYSSQVTENIKGKGTIVDSTQYYTETNGTQHSGLTNVIKDKKRKWSVNTYIVTRMAEDTSTGAKTIRSVTEVGTTQYIIDKVDITMASGKISYISSQDIYNTALPRGGDPKAKDYAAIDVLEDGVGIGTFTGTMKETQGDQEIVRDVTIDRDNLYRFAVKMKYKSTVSRPKALADDIQIPLTRQDLSNMSISLPSISGTFTGYYEAGSLFGTITTSSGNFDVVVADEGVAVNDVLYPY